MDFRLNNRTTALERAATQAAEGLKTFDWFGNQRASECRKSNIEIAFWYSKSCITCTCGDGGLEVRLMTGDREVPGSNPTRTVGFFLSRKSVPRLLIFTHVHQFVPWLAVFVRFCYPLSAISQSTLLEKGRAIVSIGRLDCTFHKVALWSGGVVSNGWLNVCRAKNTHLNLTFTCKSKLCYWKPDNRCQNSFWH